MVTRTALVAKIERFSTKNGDEISSRRQNRAFFNWKWWREQLSSPKLSISELKTVTRTALVAKFGRFSTKNGDEIGFRRQIWAFFN